MAGLMPGDRVPDFGRPDTAGKPCLFYDLHYGQPVVLFVGGRADDNEARAQLAAVYANDPDWKDVTRVVIAIGTQAQCAPLAGAAKPGFVLLVDDGQLAGYLLGPPPYGAGFTALVLDSNLRITDRLRPAAGEADKAFLQRVADLYHARPRPEAAIIRQQAPALFIPGVMDRELCDGLIALFEETGGQPSGTAYIEGDQALWKPNPSVKMRRDIYLQEGAWLERVKEAMVRRVLPEIQRCFNFQVTQHEVFKVIRYDEGAGYFRPHRDNESRDTQHRRFALTLNLNTGDYEGGQLRFPEFGPNLYEAGRGGAAVFSCSLLHEITPVTKGKRYAVLGFFFGDAQQMNPMQYKNVAGK